MSVAWPKKSYERNKIILLEVYICEFDPEVTEAEAEIPWSWTQRSCLVARFICVVV